MNDKSNKNFVKYEFIGTEIEITDSKNKSLIEKKGKITDETRNMFVLDNEKKVIKSQCTFKMKINKKNIEIKGKVLVGRPEDRIKKQLK